MCTIIQPCETHFENLTAPNSPPTSLFLYVVSSFDLKYSFLSCLLSSKNELIFLPNLKFSLYSKVYCLYYNASYFILFNWLIMLREFKSSVIQKHDWGIQEMWRDLSWDSVPSPGKMEPSFLISLHNPWVNLTLMGSFLVHPTNEQFLF